MGAKMIEVEGNTDYISIPLEDFQEYSMLLKARQVICDTIEREGGITVLETLSCLGGSKANRLYRELLKEDSNAEDQVDWNRD